MSIPPRPWKVEKDSDEDDLDVDIADDRGLFLALDVEPHAAELIVRLVNAEPEIVAALEAAETKPCSGCVIDGYKHRCDRMDALKLVRAALRKVRQ